MFESGTLGTRVTIAQWTAPADKDSIDLSMSVRLHRRRAARHRPGGFRASGGVSPFHVTAHDKIAST